jgi:predicted transposase YbfD/YdcC
VVYGVTSLSPEKASPARILSLVRRHWGIEANHWIRDAVFGEDKSATRKGSAPVFMTLLRNLAIALLRLSGRNQIAGSLRFFSWKPSHAVSFLGF